MFHPFVATALAEAKLDDLRREAANARLARELKGDAPDRAAQLGSAAVAGLPVLLVLVLVVRSLAGMPA